VFLHCRRFSLYSWDLKNISIKVWVDLFVEFCSLPYKSHSRPTAFPKNTLRELTHASNRAQSDLIHAPLAGAQVNSCRLAGGLRLRTHVFWTVVNAFLCFYNFFLKSFFTFFDLIKCYVTLNHL